MGGGANFMGLGAISQDLLYVYDLPKDVQLQNIHEYYKKHVGDCMPEIKRNPNKPFYLAIVRFNNHSDFKRASEEHQYPTIKGRVCRSLPFDRDFKTNQNLGSNLFIKGLSKDTTNKDLHEHFEKAGVVKSAKVSISENFESRGYGFVQFLKEDEAEKAVQELNNSELKGYKLQVEKYLAKNRRGAERIFNNLYVKEIPKENFGDKELEGLFSKFGRILSAKVMYELDGTTSRGFGFVCFEDCEAAK